ncbi:SpaA isopeptide-forming pilin-related protein [Cellulosimicrobium cellulans]|uniref:DUF7927 domain-containing protein n=1 Tax=Cellulosimicrobium cellulans TaxID=1710 RepID=UPI003661CE44
MRESLHRFRAAVAAASAALLVVVLVPVLSAPAHAVDDTGQVRLTGWTFSTSASGASTSSPLVGSASAFGQVTVSSPADSLVPLIDSEGGDYAWVKETSAARADGCMQTATLGQFKECGIKGTVTITFPHPVVNPALRLSLGSGTAGSWTSTCTHTWHNLRVARVDGAAPAAGMLRVVEPAPSGNFTWDAASATYSMATSAIPTDSCSGRVSGASLIGVSGLVSSIQIESSQWAVVSKGLPGSATASSTGGASIGLSMPLTDLQVAKSAPAVVDAGGRLTWDITVRNNGAADSHGYVVHDAVPASVDDVSLLSAPEGCTLDGRDLVCVSAPPGCTAAQSSVVPTWADLVCATSTHADSVVLAAGRSAPAITLRGTTPMPRGTVVTNTAHVSGVDSDSNTANNVSAATTTLAAPTLVVGKSITERADVTDQFVVTASSGRETAVDVTTTGSATSATSATTQVVRGQRYTISESMAPRSASTIDRYSGRLVCTDDAGSSAPVSGEGPSWEFTPAENRPYSCVVTNTPRAFTVDKSASVAAAHTGDTVRYEIRLTNTSQARYTTTTPASFTDDLSGVLDDAGYAGDVSGGATLQDGTLSWSGPLDVGETVTIAYSVTVASTLAGDQSMVNTVITPDGTGGNCPAADPAPGCSTTTPIALRTAPIQVEKVADGARLAGSQFAILADVDGAPGDPVSDIGGAQSETGLFDYTLAAPGTYWLRETTAPVGYALLAGPVRFTVSSSGVVTLDDPQAGPQVTVTNDGHRLTVVDVAALELPHTGGSGTTSLYLTGGALLVLATLIAAARIGRARSGRPHHHRKEIA